MLLSCH